MQVMRTIAIKVLSICHRASWDFAVQTQMKGLRPRSILSGDSGRSNNGTLTLCLMGVPNSQFPLGFDAAFAITLATCEVVTWFTVNLSPSQLIR